MIAVYAHKFPDGQVVCYADTLAMRRVAVFGRDLSNKPTKRNKHVTINCYKYILEWI